MATPFTQVISRAAVCNNMVAAVIGLSCLLLPPKANAVQVSFNRDVRPILSENCFHCHGGDEKKRKGKLRLDTAEGARKEGVIVAGKPDESELIKRILTEETDDQMPPPDSNRRLTAEQKAVLKTWVANGAKYEAHWAFAPPVRPDFPALSTKGWTSNGIDHFILAKLEAGKLTPAQPAPLDQLLRRLSFDLVGLPATAEQIKRWSTLRDPVAGAADDLMASPQFGERMAVDWMDVARYADTHGFNNDSSRSMWRWRDWVIDAFNRNMPYNQFITEQLAGDLLERPTMEQLIATGFNRNHVINSEGGIIDEEYRVEYVADRVRTTSTAWLGLTTECARCHDHKFDPISQRDYFRLFAFFNNVDEHGEDGRVANASPMMASPTKSQRETMEEQMKEIQAAEETISSAIAGTDLGAVDFQKLAETLPVNSPEGTNVIVALDLSADAVSNRVSKAKPFNATAEVVIRPGPAGHNAIVFDGTNSLKTEGLPKNESGKGWAFAAWVRREGAGEAPIFSTASFSVPESSQSYGQGVEIRLTETGAVDVRLAIRWPAYSVNVVSRERLALGEWHHVLVTRDGSPWAKGVRVFIDGEEVARDVLHDNAQSPVSLSGSATIGISGDQKLRPFAGALADVRAIAAPFKVDQLAAWSRSEMVRFALTAVNPGAREQSIRRAAWLEKTNELFASAMSNKRAAQARLLKIQREAPTTMIMRELSSRRPTHVLFRGEYDKPREQVDAGVPEFLLPFPNDLPKNRLGLAHWLTSPEHPLTSRVVVNRFWQSIFGHGIVKSAEDFGLQSDWPSHRELLDWLAVEFIESGWNVKHLLKLIVTSSTYRQDSRSTPALAERDPENRLLARGPRHRLAAEMIRDQALAISGLLHNQVGGPPVYPYQPTNLYKGIVVAADYPGTSYAESKGADLYRRSMYTFWKRTVPHPTLATFDAPDREVCVARRLKTNTPLQALGLMNDRIQLEAAGRFARRMLAEGGANAVDRIAFALYSATARKPAAEEVRQVADLLEKRVTHYRKVPEEAKAYLAALGTKAEGEIDAGELAAYANIASLILNLDETISKN